MDLNNSVYDNLKLFGLDADVKPATIKHLEKVDEVLKQMIALLSNAIEDIKNSKISINRVAKESGIARQTFYNNPIITTYIEKYIENNPLINPFDTIDTLREELRRKDKQILDMVQRDASISKFKAENKMLKEEISSLKSTIRSQEELIKQQRMQKRSN